MTRSQRFLSTAHHAEAPPPDQAVTVESDFVVILAALLCALLCVVGLIAVARCACLRRRRTSIDANNNASQAQASANRGLKKKVLQSLPKLTYMYDKDAAKFASVECAICLGEFAEGDEIRVLPQCGHVFHVGCVDTWLGSHSSCPSCRQILVVARCHRCGQFPAVSEAEMKAPQQNSNATNSFLP
ncbi:RING-H2 finger protein ATL80-like [Durio zibethinus]|uniref:RING-type E3 ubiquitin transferase n=1 Tax=Durio zibethinus TaxID=66656 RepID=A0A6P5YJ63_DURZI|nr:RING-H2 finger protein ATL80-like [Durio zibethinus]